MKPNKDMDELVDMFIKSYAVKPKVNTLKNKGMSLANNYLRFIYQ